MDKELITVAPCSVVLLDDIVNVLKLTKRAKMKVITGVKKNRKRNKESTYHKNLLLRRHRGTVARKSCTSWVRESNDEDVHEAAKKTASLNMVKNENGLGMQVLEHRRLSPLRS